MDSAVADASCACVQDQNQDRIARLCQHIVSQRCMYPLFPPAPGACLDFAFCQHLTLPCTPHLVILPSDLGACAKLNAWPQSKLPGATIPCNEHQWHQFEGPVAGPSSRDACVRIYCTHPHCTGKHVPCAAGCGIGTFSRQRTNGMTPQELSPQVWRAELVSKRNTVSVNPGRASKGKAGTFATIKFDLPADQASDIDMQSRCQVEIMRMEIV